MRIFLQNALLQNHWQIYVEGGSAPTRYLIDSFVCILDLMEAALWGPDSHVRVILIAEHLRNSNKVER